MTGYTRDEIVGQRCTVLQCDACTLLRNSSRTHWCRLFENPQGRRDHIRCDIIAKTGTIVPVLKNAVLLKNDQGETIGAVETLIDLSEIEKRDRKIAELARRIPPENRFFGMLGQSQAMRHVFELIEKAARSEAPVIIYGESGTGKELAAHAIHRLSGRCDEPLIQLNCAALNEALLESELFGHVKGAFTGAYRHRTGRFEAASRGAIFLDEIGEMPWQPRPSCCACWRANSSNASGTTPPYRWMCGSSPPPTKTWPTCCGAGNLGRIFSSESASSPDPPAAPAQPPGGSATADRRLPARVGRALR